MKLDNPFPARVRNLYFYVYACFDCGRSDQGLELHHITGRDSDSAFNACPLCKLCHIQITHSREEEKRLAQKNLQYLSAEKYVPLDKDWKFLTDHPWLVL